MSFIPKDLKKEMDLKIDDVSKTKGIHQKKKKSEKT
ncbi:unnamed protein product, partial [marine sediment metagenome]